MSRPMMPRFEWERVLRALPSTSPLFAHDRCAGGCRHHNGTQLSAGTIKKTGFVLATWAWSDGSGAHPGLANLVTGTCSKKATVIKALRHLEVVGLIACKLKGGQYGVPRTLASEYYLAVPDFEQLEAVIEPSTWRWFAQAS